MTDITSPAVTIEARTVTLLADTSRLYHEHIDEIRAAVRDPWLEQSAPESSFAAIALLAASFALEAGYSCEDIRAAARFLTAPSNEEAKAALATL